MIQIRRAIVRVLVALAIAAAIMGSELPSAFAQQYDSSLYSGLRWRMIGPFRGGCDSSACSLGFRAHRSEPA